MARTNKWLENARRIRKNLVDQIRYYTKQGVDTGIDIPDTPSKDPDAKEKSAFTRAIHKASKKLTDAFSLNKKRKKEERSALLESRKKAKAERKIEPPKPKVQKSKPEKPKSKPINSVDMLEDDSGKSGAFKAKKDDSGKSGGRKAKTKRKKPESKKKTKTKKKKPESRKKKLDKLLSDIPDKYKKMYLPDIMDDDKTPEEISEELRKKIDYAEKIFENIEEARATLPANLAVTVGHSLDELIEKYGKEQLAILLDKLDPKIKDDFMAAIKYEDEARGTRSRRIRAFFDMIKNISGEIPEIKELKKVDTALSETEQF